MEVDDDNDEEEDLEEERFRWTTPLSILSSMLLQLSSSLLSLSRFILLPRSDDAQLRSGLDGLPERRPLAFFESRMKSVSETCFGC